MKETIANYLQCFLTPDTGVAILPGSLEFTTGPRIKLIPMVPKPPPLLVGVAWVPSRLSNPAAQLIEFAKNSAGYPSSKD